jgi:signal transduction histidine kinase
MDLSTRFLVAALFVVGTAMVVFGDRITKRIEDQVLLSTAISEALFMEREIGPETRKLLDKSLHPNVQQQLLDAIAQGFIENHKLIGIKIWDTEGRIVHATRKELIGQRFSVDDDLARALKGTISASYTEFDASEPQAPPNIDQLFYDVYFPVLSAPSSGTVIGVAEFYLNADDLQLDLKKARYKSWLEVGGFALAMVFSLFAIVWQGSKTIDQQRSELRLKLSQQAELINRNSELQKNVDEAHRESIKHTEQFLQRIGADLHDGPAQNLSFALLQLEELSEDKPTAEKIASSTLVNLSRSLREPIQVALKDIRDMSAGFALPDIECLDPRDVILRAVRAHEARTDSHVEVDLDRFVNRLTYADKICIYRVVQEGLNNAFHHAGGLGQRVEARQGSNHIEVSVIDRGHGFKVDSRSNGSEHLGLIGLKHRAEALGGLFRITTSKEAGTVLQLRLPTIDHGA